MAAAVVPRERFLAIRELSTWTAGWKIKGRVIDKTLVSQFRRNDGTPGRVGTVDIMDKEGVCIRAKFWGDAADKWMQYLEKGNVYTFSGGRVQVVANRRFNPFPHNYEISFETTANIHRLEEEQSAEGTIDLIPLRPQLNCVTLRDIKNSPQQCPFQVDLRVIVRWVSSRLDSFTARDSTEGVRRLITVADDSGFEMLLTLFGDLAKLDIFYGPAGGKTVPFVITVSKVQIREFRGRVGSTLRGSYLESDHNQIEGAKELLQWYESALKSSTVFTSLSEPSSGGGGALFGGSGLSIGLNGSPAMEDYGGAGNFDTLKDVSKFLLNSATGQQLSGSQMSSLGLGSQDGSSQQNSNASIFRVIAEPGKLLYASRNGEINLLYSSCTRCNKKLFGDSAPFTCEACSITLQEPNYRFMFAAALVDWTGSRLTVRAFDDAGRTLLGRAAATVAPAVAKKRVESLSPEMRQLLEYDALWKKYVIRLRCREEIYAGELRASTAILSIEPLDFSAHARRLLKDIRSVLLDLPSAADGVMEQNDGLCEEASKAESEGPGAVKRSQWKRGVPTRSDEETEDIRASTRVGGSIASNEDPDACDENKAPLANGIPNESMNTNNSTGTHPNGPKQKRAKTMDSSSD